MNKAELIAKIAEESKLTKKAAETTDRIEYQSGRYNNSFSEKEGGLCGIPSGGFFHKRFHIFKDYLN